MGSNLCYTISTLMNVGLGDCCMSPLDHNYKSIVIVFITVMWETTKINGTNGCYPVKQPKFVKVLGMTNRKTFFYCNQGQLTSIFLCDRF